MLTYFYTRFGIGVSDPRWWEFRMRLFKAVALPSIARHLGEDTRYAIFVDDMMETKYRRQLDLAIQTTGKASYIDVLPVPVYPYALRMMGAMFAHLEEVRLIRIADDDAISADFLELAPNELGLYTFPVGYEVDLADLRMHTLNYPFASMNAIFQGSGFLAKQYVKVGHNRQKVWAEEKGLNVHFLSAPHEMYIYSRHKQSDNDFAKVRTKIYDDPTSSPFTVEVRNKFGINEDLFQEWRIHAQTAPSTKDKRTWDKSGQILNKEVPQAMKQLDLLNKEVRSRTYKLFE